MTAIDLLLEAVGDEWWRSLCCECGYPTAAEEGPVVSVGYPTEAEGSSGCLVCFESGLIISVT